MIEKTGNGWKLVSHNQVYSSEYIELYEDELNINGKKKIYIQGTRKNYSTIVPFISNKEILIIKSYRHLVDSVQIEIPSGYIESGETPIEAAVREFKEETGYVATELKLIGEYTLDYSMFHQRGYIFVAYGIQKKDQQSLGVMEKIEINSLSIDKIKQLLREGKILNAASIVALYKAIEYHEERIDKTLV
ncbi:MAG: NUDIX hydrolase [Nitrososphaeraceae archaeon]